LGARVIVEHYKHHIFEIEFKNHHDFPLARTFHDMSKDPALSPIFPWLHSRPGGPGKTCGC
jgi:hypothetical protein